MAWVISALELVRMSISSAKARRSPLLTISFSFSVVPNASYKYTLNSIGESTPPCTTPRSAEKECLPITTCDFWYIFTMSSAIILSESLRHLLSSILQSFSLFTVS